MAMCCVYIFLRPSTLSAWTSLYETWYAQDSTSAVLNGVLNKFLPSVCVYHPTFARQRLWRNVTAAKNTQSAIEVLLVASFSMWSVS
jgi:hypothetical protein